MKLQKEIEKLQNKLQNNTKQLQKFSEINMTKSKHSDEKEGMIIELVEQAGNELQQISPHEKDFKKFNKVLQTFKTSPTRALCKRLIELCGMRLINVSGGHEQFDYVLDKKNSKSLPDTHITLSDHKFNEIISPKKVNDVLTRIHRVQTYRLESLREALRMGFRAPLEPHSNIKDFYSKN